MNNNNQDLISQLLDLVKKINQLYQDDDSDSAKIDKLTDERIAIYKQLDTIKTAKLIEQGKILSQQIYQIEKSDNKNDKQRCENLDEIYWDIVKTLHTKGTDEEFSQAKKLVASKQPFERIFGADILGQLAYEDKQKYYEYAVTKLVEMLDDNDDSVLYSVAFSLGHRLKNDDNRAVEKLTQLANHTDSDVRYAVVHGLTCNESQLAIDTMIELSKDERDLVRDWATFGLARQIDLDEPQIREALHERLDDKDFDVRGEALVGLSSRGDYSILDKLKQELSGEYEADYVLEASKNLADASLLPYLLKIQKDVTDMPSYHISVLKEAIEACSAPQNSTFKEN